MYGPSISSAYLMPFSKTQGGIAHDRPVHLSNTRDSPKSTAPSRPLCKIYRRDARDRPEPPGGLLLKDVLLEDLVRAMRVTAEGRHCSLRALRADWSRSSLRVAARRRPLDTGSTCLPNARPRSSG